VLCFYFRKHRLPVPQKGSVLALPDTLNMVDKGAAYVVEGIGYDFVPQVLSRDPAVVNTWIKTSDEDAWAAVRILMRTEGLLVGGSSGSALSGALSWLQTTEEGQTLAGTVGANVVVLLPDG
jgi:cystathionine beta-synthase